MGLYVAADGNYGDSEGIALINDADWTDFEYDLLEELSTDWNRADFAEGIDHWVKDGRKTFYVGGVAVSTEDADAFAEALIAYWISGDKNITLK